MTGGDEQLSGIGADLGSVAFHQLDAVAGSKVLADGKGGGVLSLLDHLNCKFIPY